MIRVATAADAPALSSSRERAFHDDPVVTWSLPSERHGWRVTGEMRFPLGGPPLWFMWREPRGAARTAP